MMNLGMMMMMHQRNVLICYSDNQLLELARKARQENSKMGILWKRSSTSSGVWKPKCFILYQNLLFIYLPTSSAILPSSPAANSSEPATSPTSTHSLTTSTKPTAVWLLEGCTCEKVLSLQASKASSSASMPSLSSALNTPAGKHAFVIMFNNNTETLMALAASTEDECDGWMAAIRESSYWQLYSDCQSFKERYTVTTKVLEAERIGKWNYVVQLDEAHDEVRRLRTALVESHNENKRLSAVKARQVVQSPSQSSSIDSLALTEDAGEELRKICKAQSLMRGWLCRKRWKTIVEEYVRSPVAEHMRKRNKIIFRMVQEEHEYVDNLNVLVSSFLRPLRMSASSAAPSSSDAKSLVITHEEVNAIFLNCQTLLFLHQIFLQGLSSALDRWPQLLIGDVFQLLVPALSIYTEYVRNHYVSVQTLAELKMNRPALMALIRQIEMKLDLKCMPPQTSRTTQSLEELLTYPMHQIPRYIINFHELLAHTHHNHVDRLNLEITLTQLEELSLQMSTEMSESENIRKNLSIERLIGEGGQVLLDPEEVLVRQGTLLEVDGHDQPPSSVSPSSLFAALTPPPLGPSTSPNAPSPTKAAPRSVYLFSHYLIIASRSSNSGKLSLVKHHGIIPLSQCLLIENTDQLSRANGNGDDDSSRRTRFSSVASGSETNDKNKGHSQSSRTEERSSDVVASSSIVLAALNQFASCSHSTGSSSDFHLLLDYSSNETVVVTFVASNPREKQLWCSDIVQCLERIRFDQILHKTRNFSITGSEAAKDAGLVEKRSSQSKKALKSSLKRSKKQSKPVIKQASLEALLKCLCDFRLQTGDFINVFLTTYRLFTTADVVIRQLMDSYSQWKDMIICRSSELGPSRPSSADFHQRKAGSVASTAYSSPRSSARLSAVRKMMSVESSHDDDCDNYSNLSAVTSMSAIADETDENLPSSEAILASSPEKGGTLTGRVSLPVQQHQQPLRPLLSSSPGKDAPTGPGDNSGNIGEEETAALLLLRQSASILPSSSVGGHPVPVTTKQIVNPGMIVFSVNHSRRRISSAVATQAFAKATASTLDIEMGKLQREHEKRIKADQVLQSAQCLNIFNIIRHWSVVYPEDMLLPLLPNEACSRTVGDLVQQLLGEMACEEFFTRQEVFAISKLLQQIEYIVGSNGQTANRQSSLDDSNRLVVMNKVSSLLVFKKQQREAEESAAGANRESIVRDSQISVFLTPPGPPDTAMQAAASNAISALDSLTVVEIAEQMTICDSSLFKSIKLSELMNQSWSKSTKERDAPTITLVTCHFNHISAFVSTSILGHSSTTDRASAIKKWLNVASTCYSMHNFNGALQIISALQSSPLYRLKKTWERLGKQTRQIFDKLAVQLSAENRFKILREELRRIDPPCVPYLGMYLQELTLIDESCPTHISSYLVNFSKMKMIYQVLSEIQIFQSVSYRIAIKHQAIEQLLDKSMSMDEDSLYRLSLMVEPRQINSNTTNQMPNYYKLYVNDTLTIMPNQQAAEDFKLVLDNLQPSLTFTMEQENAESFCGVLLAKTTELASTSVHVVKSTDTGLVLNYQSHIDDKY